MLAWIVAGLPGSVFSAGVAFSLMLAVLGPWVAAKVALACLVACLASWAWLVPRWTARSVLGRFDAQADPLLDWSWKRAFDGSIEAQRPPAIRVLGSPVPLFLVMNAPTAGPSLWVSRGWLHVHGEEGFRQACRTAAPRLGSARLRRQTRVALALAWMVGWAPRQFWSAGFLSSSEYSRRQGLSPLNLSLGLALLAWMRWVARSAPRVAAPSGNGRQDGVSSPASVEWVGRIDAAMGPLEQLLALEPAGPTAPVQPGQNSILSWIPAR